MTGFIANTISYICDIPGSGTSTKTSPVTLCLPSTVNPHVRCEHIFTPHDDCHPVQTFHPSRDIFAVFPLCHTRREKHSILMIINSSNWGLPMASMQACRIHVTRSSEAQHTRIYENHGGDVDRLGQVSATLAAELTHHW